MPRLFTFVCLLWLTAASATAQEISRDNVKRRGELSNSLLKFQRDHEGTVAFIGGSITEMNGYRPMVCEFLKKRFPETRFTFIDAGISSTCSTTGAFRLQHDVLDKGTVDLFFIEFAVNDDQDAHHTRQECIRGMEGIIRHARRANPNMDIVVTCFVNEGMLQTIGEGKTPLPIEAHEVVCQRYGVSSIHLAQEVSDQIRAGKLTWEKYGGVHPAPFGNALCTRLIEQLLNEAWKSPAAQIQPHSMPEALDSLSYERGRFIDPHQAKLGDGWTLAVPDWAHLPGSKRDRFTSIPMLCADQVGAEASLEFEGTAIGAYVVAGPDAGMLEASIDGGNWRPVDLYHPFSKGLHYPRTVIFSDDLKPGMHRLAIRVAQKSSSGGHAARIMQFVAN